MIAVGRPSPSCRGCFRIATMKMLRRNNVIPQPGSIAHSRQGALAISSSCAPVISPEGITTELCLRRLAAHLEDEDRARRHVANIDPPLVGVRPLLSADGTGFPHGGY